ncbi:hypothetical protein JCM10213_003674 [Rhodosporidiobolus nylandii]
MPPLPLELIERILLIAVDELDAVKKDRAAWCRVCRSWRSVARPMLLVEQRFDLAKDADRWADTFIEDVGQWITSLALEKFSAAHLPVLEAFSPTLLSLELSFTYRPRALDFLDEMKQLERVGLSCRQKKPGDLQMALAQVVLLPHLTSLTLENFHADEFLPLEVSFPSTLKHLRLRGITGGLYASSHLQHCFATFPPFQLTHLTLLGSNTADVSTLVDAHASSLTSLAFTASSRHSGHYSFLFSPLLRLTSLIIEDLDYPRRITRHLCGLAAARKAAHHPRSTYTFALVKKAWTKAPCETALRRFLRHYAAGTRYGDAARALLDPMDAAKRRPQEKMEALALWIVGRLGTKREFAETAWMELPALRVEELLRKGGRLRREAREREMKA